MARIAGFFGWLGLGVTLLHGQRLLVGPTGRDTVLPAGKVVVRYVAPAQWQRDTFLLIVRNALGVLTRVRLYPRPNAPHYGELTLTKPGYLVLLVQHPRIAGRIWASHRLYALAPPCTTVVQVRAYHNALLARRSPPTTTSPTAIDEVSASLEDLSSISEPFPDVPSLSDLQIDEELLPDEVTSAPKDPSAPIDIDEDLMDD